MEKAGSTATLRVHHLLDASRANGPGTRAVLWLQGCSRHCAGCFNPETHDPAAGRTLPLPALLEWYERVAPRIDGLTVSGGEPLEQAASLRLLLEAARHAADLPVLLFTGWTWPEIEASAEASACVRLADAVLAGPYVRPAAGDGRPLRRGAAHAGGAAPPGSGAATRWGSPGQELRLLSGRFTPADFVALPAAEVWVAGDGALVVTGIDPPRALDLPGASPRPAMKP